MSKKFGFPFLVIFFPSKQLIVNLNESHGYHEAQNGFAVLKDQISDALINLPRLFQNNQMKHNGQRE